MYRGGRIIAVASRRTVAVASRRTVAVARFSACQIGRTIGLPNWTHINDEVIEKEMGFIEELIELNGNSNTNFKGLPYFYDVQVRNIEAVLIVVLRMTKRDD